MTPRIYFILIFTFITGMFSGGYLYITSFAPDYKQSDVEALSEIDFRLQGQMQGGCQMAGVCPSFELDNNASYEYLPSYLLEDGEPEKKLGKLDLQTYKEIVVALNGANFEALQKEGGLCASASDGTDYVYNVIIKGEVHILNTCSTVFGTSQLATQLSSVWNTFSSPEDNKTQDIRGPLEKYLQNSFER